LCAWNKAQFKSSYVINAGDFVITSAQTFPASGNSGFSVYPNPVKSDWMKIKVPPENLNSEFQVSILDITGRNIQKTDLVTLNNELEINTKGLKAGIYFIKIQSGNFRQVEKFVVE
jgi:hypothetical protein